MAEAELIRGNSRGSLINFVSAKKAYPEDENIYRELLIARLSDSGKIQEIIKQIDTILDLVRKGPA
jgi:hypothetical protein